jgi:hypothetical protein
MKAHCVVYIVDGENAAMGMSQDFGKKIKKIEELLRTGMMVKLN